MQLKGRRVDPFGNVVLNEQGICDQLMQGSDISGLTVEPSPGVERFNALCLEWDHPDDALALYSPPEGTLEEFDAANQSRWITPEPFASIDVLEWLLSKCSTDEQTIRVCEEWILYRDLDMEKVLRFFIYLVDYFRENDLVWGVGRGSSVSSYCLFLIGVHKIDSIKYQLDYREFLR